MSGLQREYWTLDDDAKVVRYLSEGLNYEEIALRIGRTRLAVGTRYLKYLAPHSKGPKRFGGKPWSQEDMATAYEMNRNGYSQQRIGDALGRSKSSVQSYLQRKIDPARFAVLQGLNKERRKTQQEKAAIRRQKYADRRLHGATAPVDHYADAAALAERDRRKQLEHSTYTARFMGDPLPGYSARDRKQA